MQLYGTKNTFQRNIKSNGLADLLIYVVNHSIGYLCHPTKALVGNSLTHWLIYLKAVM